MAHAPIRLEAHAPERRQRRGGVQLNSGCCCCCCCLHAAGGLVGALIGSISAASTVPPPPRWIPPTGDVLSEFRPRPPEQVSSLPPLTDRPLDRPDDHVIDRLNEPLPEPRADPDDPLWSPTNSPPRGMSGTSVYWLTLLVLTPIACILVGAYNGRPSEPFDWSAGILGTIFLGLPFVQLAASGVAAMIVLLGPADSGLVRLRQVGRITLWSLAGTLVGTGALALMCGVMR